jgi:hypothetical protein
MVGYTVVLVTTWAYGVMLQKPVLLLSQTGATVIGGR